jgi:heat shock protein HslJ
MARAVPTAFLLAGALALGGASASVAQDPEASSRVRPDTLPTALRPDALAPLEGTAWRLRAYDRDGTVRTAGPEVAAWLRLSGGRLRGSGGCTKLNGRYGRVGAALDITLRKVKRPRCAEQTTIVQLAMVDGLRDAASHALLSDDTGGTALRILDAADVVRLEFEPDDLATLEGTEWRLRSYARDGVETAADELQPAVLTFEPRRSQAAQRRSEGELVGSTGCNGVVGDFFRRADVLSLGPLDRTEAPCEGAAAAQEAAMLAVLDATAIRLELPADRLILTASDTGDRLELESATPLEGTTWLLDGLPQRIPSGTSVTLRLSDGQVGGEGPCGPITGAYVADRGFLTLAPVTTERPRGCGQRARARKLLRALDGTVRAEVVGSRLSLVDANGRVVARLRAPGSP